MADSRWPDEPVERHHWYDPDWLNWQAGLSLASAFAATVILVFDTVSRSRAILLALVLLSGAGGGVLSSRVARWARTPRHVRGRATLHPLQRLAGQWLPGTSVVLLAGALVWGSWPEAGQAASPISPGPSGTETLADGDATPRTDRPTTTETLADGDATEPAPDDDGLSLRDTAELLGAGLGLAQALAELSAEGAATVGDLRAFLGETLRDLGVARAEQLSTRLLDELLDAIFEGDPPQGDGTVLPPDWLDRLPAVIQQALDDYEARQESDVTVTLPDRVTVDLSDRTIRRLLGGKGEADDISALSADVRRLGRLVERVLRMRRPDGSRPPEPGDYDVRAGNSLWAIAARLLGPDASEREIDRLWRELYRRNRQLIGRDPDLLRPGQRLRLRRP